ncbi:MAG: alpha/beta hydrolase [Mucilaginibacter sp.]|nr:alpha/beta hydrolase [Mucilaginibacter sp.]
MSKKNIRTVKNTLKRLWALTWLLILGSCFSYAQQINTMEKLKTSGYAPVNGLKMYYEIYGSGITPLVLIHGGGSTIETTFGNMLPLLSGYGKLITLELQAHGRTNNRDAPESFEQDADDVATLLKYLKIDKANFFGFSNGGTTTLQIAIRHPEIVNKIVVASGAYKRDGFIPGFFDGFQNATLDNMPEPLKVAFLKVTPDKGSLQVMFDKDVSRMKTFKDMADDDLRSIKAPALLMAADHDVTTPEHALKMSHLIPNAQLVILPGTHGSFIGAAEVGNAKGSKLPEVTAVLVEEFLIK